MPGNITAGTVAVAHQEVTHVVWVWTEATNHHQIPNAIWYQDRTMGVAPTSISYLPTRIQF